MRRFSIYRQGATLLSPELGSLELYVGLIRRNKVRHAHLMSPDGQTCTCVPARWLHHVLHAKDWYEAVHIARHGPEPTGE